MIRFNRTDPSLAGSNYKPGELPGGPYLAIVKAVGDPTRNNRVSVALARDGKNLDNKEVLINQVGWAGINIGRIDFIFGQKKNKKQFISRSICVQSDKKTV